MFMAFFFWWTEIISLHLRSLMFLICSLLTSQARMLFTAFFSARSDSQSSLSSKLLSRIPRTTPSRRRLDSWSPNLQEESNVFVIHVYGLSLRAGKEFKTFKYPVTLRQAVIFELLNYIVIFFFLHLQI